jgi:hypothetical protein
MNDDARPAEEVTRPEFRGDPSSDSAPGPEEGDHD